MRSGGVRRHRNEGSSRILLSHMRFATPYFARAFFGLEFICSIFPPLRLPTTTRTSPLCITPTIAMSGVVCARDGCQNLFEGIKESTLGRKFCPDHLFAYRIHRSRKYCLVQACLKQASCNHEGVLPALYCRYHKQEGMVCIKTPKCAEPGCSKRASCNYPGAGAVRKFCGTHKLDEMVFLHRYPSRPKGKGKGRGRPSTKTSSTRGEPGSETDGDGEDFRPVSEGEHLMHVYNSNSKFEISNSKFQIPTNKTLGS